MKKSLIARRTWEIQMNTILIEAVVEGNATEVSRLLKAGANPSAANSEGFTALHFSAFTGNAEISQILMNAGASIIKTDIHGKSPITVAQEKGNREVADLMLRSFFGNSKGRA